MLNDSDIMQLCRLCLVKDEVNIPIFEEQGDLRQILSKITSCLPVKVTKDDQLPKKICDHCSCKLDLLYEFWNTSANSEKQLLEWLSDRTKIETTNNTNASTKLTPIKLINKEEMDIEDTVVKQETVDPVDSHAVENSALEVDQSGDEGGSPMGEGASSTNEDEEEEEEKVEPPPPKRARRAAAMRKPIQISQETDDEDDVEIPKIEDDVSASATSFTDAPSTSAEDQPGPSGLGKESGLEAPSRPRSQQDPKATIKDVRIILTDIKYDPTIMKTLRKQKPESAKFSCLTCNCDFSSTDGILSHKNKDQLTCHFLCLICHKNIISCSTLKAHMLVHEKKVKSTMFKYTCFICGKKFADCFDLQRHEVFTHKMNSTRKGRLKTGKETKNIQQSLSPKVNHKESQPKIQTELTLDKVHEPKIENSFEVKTEYEISDRKTIACDICYDEFDCEDDYKEHQALHEELETSGNINEIAIKDEVKDIDIEHTSLEIDEIKIEPPVQPPPTLHPFNLSNAVFVVANSTTPISTVQPILLSTATTTPNAGNQVVPQYSLSNNTLASLLSTGSVPKAGNQAVSQISVPSSQLACLLTTATINTGNQIVTLNSPSNNTLGTLPSAGSKATAVSRNSVQNSHLASLLTTGTVAPNTGNQIVALNSPSNNKLGNLPSAGSKSKAVSQNSVSNSQLASLLTTAIIAPNTGNQIVTLNSPSNNKSGNLPSAGSIPKSGQQIVIQNPVSSSFLSTATIVPITGNQIATQSYLPNSNLQSLLATSVSTAGHCIVTQNSLSNDKLESLLTPTGIVPNAENPVIRNSLPSSQLEKLFIAATTRPLGNQVVRDNSLPTTSSNTSNQIITKNLLPSNKVLSVPTKSPNTENQIVIQTSSLSSLFSTATTSPNSGNQVVNQNSLASNKQDSLLKNRLLEPATVITIDDTDSEDVSPSTQVTPEEENVTGLRTYVERVHPRKFNVYFGQKKRKLPSNNVAQTSSTDQPNSSVVSNGQSSTIENSTRTSAPSLTVESNEASSPGGKLDSATKELKTVSVLKSILKTDLKCSTPKHEKFKLALKSGKTVTVETKTSVLKSKHETSVETIKPKSTEEELAELPEKVVCETETGREIVPTILNSLIGKGTLVSILKSSNQTTVPTIFDTGNNFLQLNSQVHNVNPTKNKDVATNERNPQRSIILSKNVKIAPKPPFVEIDSTTSKQKVTEKSKSNYISNETSKKTLETEKIATLNTETEKTVITEERSSISQNIVSDKNFDRTNVLVISVIETGQSENKTSSSELTINETEKNKKSEATKQKSLSELTTKTPVNPNTETLLSNKQNSVNASNEIVQISNDRKDETAPISSASQSESIIIDSDSDSDCNLIIDEEHSDKKIFNIFVRKDLLGPSTTSDDKKKDSSPKKRRIFVYECQYCKLKFPKHRHLRQHNKRLIECSDCSFKSCKSVEMKYHCKNHNKHFCTRCNKVLENYNLMKQHILETHVCKKCYAVKINVKSHEKDCKLLRTLSNSEIDKKLNKFL